MQRKISRLKFIILLLLLGVLSLYIFNGFRERQLLNKIIERLSADSRAAEVVVTDVRHDPKTRKNYTTIKFLEYGVNSKPLKPRYFTFSGNMIQLQSMVVRFDDLYVKNAHPLKGKSAYLFMKAFMLDGKNTEVFDITKIDEVPAGYAVEGNKNSFERKLWGNFWEYALNTESAKKNGVKNAQIEAPGTKFVPGLIYRIKIEHDGGLRIDAEPLPGVLTAE